MSEGRPIYLPDPVVTPQAASGKLSTLLIALAVCLIFAAGVLVGSLTSEGRYQVVKMQPSIKSSVADLEYAVIVDTHDGTIVKSISNDQAIP